jgi:hypothetical protein
VPKPEISLHPDAWMPKILAAETLEEMVHALRQWIAAIEKVKNKKPSKSTK